MPINEMLILSLVLDYIVSKQELVKLKLVSKYIHNEIPLIVDPYIVIIDDVIEHMKIENHTIYKLTYIDETDKYEITFKKQRGKIKMSYDNYELFIYQFTEYQLLYRPLETLKVAYIKNIKNPSITWVNNHIKSILKSANLTIEKL